MAQLVARVDDRLAAAIDELVDAGALASRSEAVRLALEDLVDRLRRRETGARIVAAYAALPQSATEVGWADEATRQMIADEPW
jgi:Arc/MetJ-type ribon-helix-helix transcriptional regulator